MPNDQANNDSAKIIKAKLALAGQAEIEDWKKDAGYLEKRREEAIKAMTSSEQKKAKEEAEKAIIDRKEAQKKLAELEAVKKAEEELKNKNQAEEQRKRDEQAELERLAKIEAILKSEKEIEKIKKNPSSGAKPIRTLTRDVGEVIGSEKLSASKIIINTPDDKKTTSTPSRIWLVGLIAFLIIGGLFVGVWSIRLRQAVITTDTLTNRQSLVFANKQIAVDLTRKSPDELSIELSTIRTNSTGKWSNNVTEIYFTYQVSTTTESGIVTTKNEAPLDVYSKQFNLNLPTDFTRQVEMPWMLGYSGEQAKPFYIFKTKNFKNLADSLLKNEGEIISALFTPFVEASTTGKISLATFRDKMIRNHDTRLVVDETNVAITIYSWLDQETLLITTDEETFIKINDSYFASR